MSEDNQDPTVRPLRPKRAWAGKSPDHEGVVIVLDPGLPTQTLIVLDPSAALAWSHQIAQEATDQIACAVALSQSFNRDEQFKIERERPSRLDS